MVLSRSDCPEGPSNCYTLALETDYAISLLQPLGASRLDGRQVLEMGGDGGSFSFIGLIVGLYFTECLPTVVLLYGPAWPTHYRFLENE